MSSKSFVAAILFAAPLVAAIPNSCRPAKSFEQGHELRYNQLAAGYNAAARTDVRGSWEVFMNFNVLYWQPIEENLELGIFSADAANEQPIVNGEIINNYTSYDFGGQAGIGTFFARDGWDGYARYTWFSTHFATRTGNMPGGNTIIPSQGSAGNLANIEAFSIESAKQGWTLLLQSMDAVLGRSCYEGTKLTFRPFSGIRGLWLTQKIDAIYTPRSDLLSPFESLQKVTSWGIGPEIGLEANWLLGVGVRLTGSAEADVLFTHYNSRIHEGKALHPKVSNIHLSQKGNCVLRPHCDLEMGLGWGTYCMNHNMHFDIYASYGFQVFWDQNMFRKFSSSDAVGVTTVPNGNLYVQGATGGMRFDF